MLARTVLRHALLSSFALSLSVALANAVPCPGPDDFGHECEPTPADSDECFPLETDRVIHDSGSSLFEDPDGVVGPPSADDGCATRTLPFPFTLYGETFTEVGVSSNGFLQLGPCVESSDEAVPSCPPGAPGDPTGAVFALWADLDPGAGGTVTDGVIGTAPDRIYAVTWEDVPFAFSAETVTFQVRLQENGGDNFVRVSVQSPGLSVTDHVSGIVSPDGSDSLVLHCPEGPFADETGFHCTSYRLLGASGPCVECSACAVFELFEPVLPAGRRKHRPFGDDDHPCADGGDEDGDCDPCGIFCALLDHLEGSRRVPEDHPCFDRCGDFHPGGGRLRR